MKYSVHSSYPIQSILPLSDTHFATLLPLDHLIQVYSVQSSQPIKSLWTSDTVYIDTKINGGFLTHGMYSLEFVSETCSYRLQTQYQIVSRAVNVQNKFMNLSSDGKLHIYDLSESIKETHSSNIQGFQGRRPRGKQIPLISFDSNEQILGLATDENQYSIYNIQYQSITKSISLGQISQIIPFECCTLINCGKTLYYHDNRVNKLIRKQQFDNHLISMKINGNSNQLMYCKDNSIICYNLQSERQDSCQILDMSSWKSIQSFQQVGDHFVVTVKPDLFLNVFEKQ